MITVGVYCQRNPAPLEATLASLSRHASDARIVLLPDAGEPTVTSEFDVYPQLMGAERGAPAALNRLVAYDEAPTVIFLESGVLVTGGWLERLIAALEPQGRGLAGPSTNASWNEQRLADAPHGWATPEAIEAYAHQVAARYGEETSTLEPLYSLADLCFAVKREVILAIGGADEGYGTGPCWEMDYNIRAARAGFEGVWVKSAYVHRSPRSAQRVREEQLGFAASKRRYQDKFCGLHLRGEKRTYEFHCRGEACPHFAPAELIRLRETVLPPQPGSSGLEPPPSHATRQSMAGTPTGSPSLLPSVPTAHSSDPLVSCIMPTCNRREFMPRAIRCFLQQDYPQLELIVVDDGTDPIRDCLPEDPRIRYVRLESKRVIGEKRNIACENARGEIIVHWDDDDWYPSWRVRVQVRALLDRPADICGSSRVLYVDPSGDRAWQYALSGINVPWVAGNTLAYRRNVWLGKRFAPVQIAEDARFIAGSGRGTVLDLADPSLCVATIHPGNTSRKALRGPHWRPEPLSRIQELLAGDMPPHISPTDNAVRSAERELPLVSCIMPTHNRRGFIPLALKLFAEQDYANRELIVVDDGDDAVGDLIEGWSGVRYIRLSGRRSIGAKRNLACAEARGEIIAHWDDDDWYAPNRLTYQVAPLLTEEADITGLENRYTLDVPTGTLWSLASRLHRRMFVGNVHGGTLVFHRSILQDGLHYPELNLAEDAMLLHGAVRRGKRLARLVNPGVFIYVRHGHNAWRFQTGQFLDPTGWEPIAPPATFPAAAIPAYQSAAARSWPHDAWNRQVTMVG